MWLTKNKTKTEEILHSLCLNVTCIYSASMYVYSGKNQINLTRFFLDAVLLPLVQKMSVCLVRIIIWYSIIKVRLINLDNTTSKKSNYSVLSRKLLLLFKSIFTFTNFYQCLQIWLDTLIAGVANKVSITFITPVAREMLQWSFCPGILQ